MHKGLFQLIFSGLNQSWFRQICAKIAAKEELFFEAQFAPYLELESKQPKPKTS